MTENILYYGDNLDILRRYVRDETVDLIYLDPPFNSKATYNVLFGEKNGSDSAAQIKAFEDSWHWDTAAAEAYYEVVESGGRVADAMRAFRLLLGDSDMLAYLAMMAPRLIQLHRVLKPTGSIYLHCDPTASHYLKVLLDAVLGPRNFRNEIVWQRFTFHADAKRFGRVTDRIVFYTKTRDFTFNQLRVPYSKEYVASKFRYVDERGRFRLDNLNPPGGRGPVYEFHGVTRAWRFTEEKMRQLEAEGRIYTKSRVAQLKRYLHELPGQAVHSLWNDISPINPRAKERLGYPTQKPEALLERIIKASSNEGDVVLDPFCGCGTAVVVAERLHRCWIGMDITHLAVTLMKHRLRDAFSDDVSFKVIGEPVSLPDAKTLARQDRFQFELWALGLVGARPTSKKRGADKGIDGRLYFHDERKGKTKQVIISVKSGHVSVSQVRDLRGVVEREKAQIGVFITLEEPTKPMRSEAASAGFYESPGWGKKYPRIQILTVAELLEGAQIQYPPRTSVTFKEAPKAKAQRPETRKLAGM